MQRLRGSFTVVALLATAASVNVAYTALIPLVPHMRSEMGASLAVIALSFTLFALARSLAQVVGGHLVDRLGARRVAVGALLLAAVAIGGFAFSRTGTDLVLWRVLWGAGEGILTPALYRLGVVIADDRGIPQAKLMGWFAAVAVGGMAAGPALVGVMGSVLDFRAIFLVAAAATAATALLAAAGLRVDEVDAQDMAARDLDVPKRTSSPLRPMLVPIVLFGCMDLVNHALYAALEPLLPLTIDSTLGGGMAATSAIFAWGLVVFALVSGAGGGLAERVRPVSFAGVSFLLMAVCLGVIGWSRGLWPLTIAFTGFMALQPLLYVVARRGLSERCAGRGSAFGYFGAISDIGFVIGPLIGTLLVAQLGDGAYHGLGAIALCAGAAFLVLGRRTAQDQRPATASRPPEASETTPSLIARASR